MVEMMDTGKIKDVELITSPTGKYTNNNAVINIVAVSELSDAFTIQTSTSANTDHTRGARLAITSKPGRFIFNTGYDYNYSNSFGSEVNSIITDYSSELYRYSENIMQNKPAPSHKHSGLLIACYNITLYDLITLSLTTQIGNNSTNITSNSQYFNIENQPTREILQTDMNQINNDNIARNLNYQHSFKNRRGRLLNETYSRDSKRCDNVSKIDYPLLSGYDAEQYKTQNRLSTVENAFGLNSYDPLSDKQNCYATMKYVVRKYNSKSWMYNLIVRTGDLEQDLDSQQKMTSIQGNYSIRKGKTKLFTQISYEYTDIHVYFKNTETSLNKEDHNLFGSILFTYRPWKKSTVIMDLSRNSFRPEITFLNPYEDKSVAGKINEGNPNLDNKNNYVAMIIFRYLFSNKFSINSENTFRYSNNAGQQYIFTDSNGMLITTFGNISKQKRLFISFGIQINPTKNLDVRLDGRIGWFNFDYVSGRNSYWDSVFAINANLQPWGGGLYCRIQYANDNLDKSFNIRASKQQYIVTGSARVSQNITKDLYLPFFVNDPWTKYKKVNLEEVSVDYYKVQMTITISRTFGMEVTCNFGRFHDQVKMSKRSIHNTDRTKLD